MFDRLFNKIKPDNVSEVKEYIEEASNHAENTHTKECTKKPKPHDDVAFDYHKSLGRLYVDQEQFFDDCCRDNGWPKPGNILTISFKHTDLEGEDCLEERNILIAKSANEYFAIDKSGGQVVTSSAGSIEKLIYNITVHLDNLRLIMKDEKAMDLIQRTKHMAILSTKSDGQEQIVNDIKGIAPINIIKDGLNPSLFWKHWKQETSSIIFPLSEGNVVGVQANELVYPILIGCESNPYGKSYLAVNITDGSIVADGRNIEDLGRDISWQFSHPCFIGWF